MNHDRITTNPTIANGTPIIRGAQVPVRQILSCAAAGQTSAEIMAEMPQLELADITAAFEYAADLVHRSPLEKTSPLQIRDAHLLPKKTETADELTKMDLNKILIVDDQELNRLYMQTMFRGSEFTISVAASGEEALAKAHAELPFLILSDIQMPMMDGFELCRLIKADEQTKNAAVIFITAYHRSSQKVSEGLDIGADDYIFRPFERNELLSRVQAVARLKRAEEDARRQAQTVARRNQALELLNELALAVTSSLDLEKIFASSMQRLSQLLNAEAVSLILLNQETQELVVNISSHTGERVSATLDFRLEKVNAWVIQERVPSIIAEALADPDVSLELDLSSISCLPMTSKDQIVGAIAIVNRQGESFSATDWVLLNSAAGIIAVAVENARLLQNVQQQVTDLVLLNEIGYALTSTLDLDRILDRTTQLVQESLRAEAASLWLLDGESKELVLTASSGPGARLVTGFRLSLHSGIAGHVARTGEPYFSPDVPGDEKHFEHVAEISDFAPGSMLCVPVQVKDQIIGVIQALHRNPRWFNQNDLRLLFSVASSVGIAVENGRLFGAVQEFNRQLEQMVAERTRELAEEKETTEAILANMADGLLVLDAEKRILTANSVAEAMLECRLSGIRGQIIGPQQLENQLWRCINDLANTSELTASASVDVPDAARPGGVFSVQAHAAQVRKAGQVIGTVIVLRDITALKEVERMKARFMTGVTHELKTPLSIIRLHANNLKTYHARLSARKRDKLLDAIQNQVKLLEQLVGDILALSRLDASAAKAKRQVVNLTQLTDQIVADLRPLANDNRITLYWSKPAIDITTLANANQMKQVIRNLVDNAIKYTPEGGFVKATLATETPDIIKVQITDSGIGIPAEHQALIFDRFYRVDPSHTIPGTGLGLSIVKEIITSTGGDLQLKSAPGSGSVFTVTLPGIEHLASD